MRPVIGIPCYSTERPDTRRPLYGNNQTYVQAVIRVGGAPMLIPPGDPEMLAAIYARLDGLLLSGGGDVDPAFFGEQAIPECDPPERERDEAEIALTQLALADGLPILGICRGMQLLNIACGGSLYQDIPKQRPTKLRHNCRGEERNFVAHTISVQPGSRVAAALGKTTEGVNSFHHQSVKEPGAGIKVVGVAKDGIAEALEMPSYPFVVAVQYHPEAMDETHESSQRLFAAFVQACRERMTSGASALEARVAS
jgi:putative glutamine amidotransferase